MPASRHSGARRPTRARNDSHVRSAVPAGRDHAASAAEHTRGNMSGSIAARSRTVSVHSGAGGTAGEIGHLSVDPRGRACPRGQRGCIETLAAGWAIAERWGRASAHPAREVFAAVGDPRAAAIRDDVVRGVAAAVRALALAVDPVAVVLGGGVSRVGEPLLDAVRAELRTSAVASPFLSSLRLEDRIERLPPGARPGALGAALLAD